MEPGAAPCLVWSDTRKRDACALSHTHNGRKVGACLPANLRRLRSKRQTGWRPHCSRGIMGSGPSATTCFWSCNYAKRAECLRRNQPAQVSGSSSRGSARATSAMSGPPRRFDLLTRHLQGERSITASILAHGRTGPEPANTDPSAQLIEALSAAPVRQYDID